MTLKNHALIFLFSCLILTETFAKDYNFVLKEDANCQLHFVLNLDAGDIVYSNISDSANPFPTSIKIFESKNLEKYALKWPTAKSKYQDGIGQVQYFDDIVKISLELDAKDHVEPINLKGEIEFVVCSDTQCIPVKQKFEEELLIHKHSFSIEEYWVFICMAILGGFILNFMPCVLPVLSLKILSFMKNDNIDRRVAALLTIGGIFSCFWILAGMMIMLKHSGRQYGLGVNFQVPEFIIILTLIITFFVSIALGRVNFNLSSVSNRLGNVQFVNPYIEHYFSGVIATILSTPCNAPFLGTALAFAFGVNDVLVVVMFSSIALGFSMPYILLIIFPKMLQILPKPGAWMDLFKKFLALLLVVTVAWLLWVLASQIGDRATFGLFLLLLLFKFSIENESGLLKNWILKVLLVLAIIISSLILPQYAHRENVNHNQNLNDVWTDFEPDKIMKLVHQGEVVFVDITADWCVTCKYNKLMALDQNRTFNLFKKHGVIAMRGDFTSRDEAISSFLEYHDSIGIPFYIVFGPAKPEGVVLPLIINYSDIANAVNLVRNSVD
jgi:suppressor for copper-sensitivity B